MSWWAIEEIFWCVYAPFKEYRLGILELKMRIAISAIVGNNTRKATRNIIFSAQMQY
jgi:hypothetical protein